MPAVRPHLRGRRSLLLPGRRRCCPAADAPHLLACLALTTIQPLQVELPGDVWEEGTLMQLIKDNQEKRVRRRGW